MSSSGIRLPSWLSWSALGSVTAVAWWMPGGCAGPIDDGTGTATGPVGDVFELTMANTANEVIVPALRDAAAASADLADAVDAWAAAPSDASAQGAAQAAWVEAMAAWQVVEVMQVGPAGSSLTAAGGEDVRDYVYSWPSDNPCRVDQETALEGYQSPTFADDELVNVLGLDALEHLLWSGDENACPSQVEINSDGTWTDLGATGVSANRAAYAAVLAEDVAARTQGLVDAWEGGFADQLAEGSGAYGSPQEALNALFDGLFYLEKLTKDRKLGTPLGLLECAEATCPDEVEAQLSGTSHQWLAANLDGFRRVFEGGDGWGFDDLLVEAGDPDLAADTVAAIAAAETALAALEGPIDEQLTASPAEVDAAHAALKAIGDLLKGDIATVLTLEIPAEAAGDND